MEEENLLPPNLKEKVKLNFKKGKFQSEKGP